MPFNQTACCFCSWLPWTQIVYSHVCYHYLQVSINCFENLLNHDLWVRALFLNFRDSLCEESLKYDSLLFVRSSLDLVQLSWIFCLCAIDYISVICAHTYFFHQDDSWGCFDEFQLLNSQAVAVVLDHVQAVLRALKAKSKKCFLADGEEVRCPLHCCQMQKFLRRLMIPALHFLKTQESLLDWKFLWNLKSGSSLSSHTKDKPEYCKISFLCFCCFLHLGEQ